MKARHVVAIAAVAGTVCAGAGLGAGEALASGSTLHTQQVTETLYNSKCYHYTSRSVTYYHWDTRASRYVPYTAPHVNTLSYNKCHA